MQGFLDAIDERVLVCDGATGTELYSRGVFLNRSFDELNLTQPDLVADVHRAYVRAGADVIETNTFGANRVKLSAFGLVDQVAAINREGARLARRVAHERAWVAGSIGPLGVRIEPFGRTSVADAEAAFAEQAAALVDGGVDLFILETFGSLAEILAAIRGVRTASSLPIVAQMTTAEPTTVADGTPFDRATAELVAAGADVVGLNCSVGPAAMLESIEHMAEVHAGRLSAQPNAGQPRDVDGRHLYLSSPEYMASYARRFVAAGVRLVGGCCGTTPEHTRQIAEAVHVTRGVPASPKVRRTTAPAGEGGQSVAARGTQPVARGLQTPGSAASSPDSHTPVDRQDKSDLGLALARRAFPVIVELAVPRGLNLEATIQQARRFSDLGAVAVSVPDYPRAGARATALALAALLERHGIETLWHRTCRGRTLAGVQADLLSAHVMGIRNVLATTGKPTPVMGQGPAPAAEVDAIGLVALAARLNQGLDLAGEPLGEPTRFHVAAAFNPLATDTDTEWRRLDRKIEAGAEFIVLPPVLDPQAVEPALARLRATGLPILAGLAALESARQAELISSEVIGARAPAGFVDDLGRAADQAAAAEAATAAIAAWLRSRVDGLVISWLYGSPTTAERWVAETVLPQPLAARGPAGSHS